METVETKILELRIKKIRVSEIAKYLNIDIKLVKRILATEERQWLERNECITNIQKIIKIDFDTAEKIYKMTKEFFYNRK